MYFSFLQVGAMRGGGLSPSPSSLVLATLLADSHLATVHSGMFTLELQMNHLRSFHNYGEGPYYGPSYRV